jgi:TPR repeat protein
MAMLLYCGMGCVRIDWSSSFALWTRALTLPDDTNDINSGSSHGSIHAWLGECRWYGRGCIEDGPISCDHYRQSSQLNNLVGQYHWALRMFEGTFGITRRFRAALDLWEDCIPQLKAKEAAGTLDMHELMTLAFGHTIGEGGLLKSNRLALPFYQKAAKLQNVLAMDWCALRAEKGDAGMFDTVPCKSYLCMTSSSFDDR